MKTRVISLLLAAVFFMPRPFCAHADGAPPTSAGSAVMIEAETGEVLYEKHSNKAMLIASTTKIMTALIVLENCVVSETVKIKPEWTNVEGSSMYLKEDEELSVKELLYGLMLGSGNDAAVALACHTAGSIESFSKLMNERAKSLGLIATSFKNPHGLDEDGHFSTAGDLAVITREAMKNDVFCKIVATKSIVAGGRELKNHNRLLWDCDGVIGVKTGYTKSAGRILVTCAKRDGMKLICVTISDPNDWADHTSLYEWAFAAFTYKDVIPCELKELALPVISGEKEAVMVAAERDFPLLSGQSDKIEVIAELPRFVYAEVVKGNVAGRLSVYKGGEFLGSINYLYSVDVKRDDSQLLNYKQRLFRMIFG